MVTISAMPRMIQRRELFFPRLNSPSNPIETLDMGVT
jgi:hypothetical protein